MSLVCIVLYFINVKPAFHGACFRRTAFSRATFCSGPGLALADRQFVIGERI